MNSHSGPRLAGILAGRPFHLMYEEDKRGVAPVINLNPLLRGELAGRKAAYPAIPRGTCDVVFDLDGARTWMECKLVQTHNGGNKPHWRFEDRNPSYEKHLGLRPAEHDSAVRDVRDRLPTLDRSGVADRIAFLMVAYDSPRFAIDDGILRFIEIGGLVGWRHDLLLAYADPREAAAPEDARIRVFLWERDVIDD